MVSDLEAACSFNIISWVWDIVRVSRMMWIRNLSLPLGFLSVHTVWQADSRRLDLQPLQWPLSCRKLGIFLRFFSQQRRGCNFVKFRTTLSSLCFGDSLHVGSFFPDNLTLLGLICFFLQQTIEASIVVLYRQCIWSLGKWWKTPKTIVEHTGKSSIFV